MIVLFASSSLFRRYLMSDELVPSEGPALSAEERGLLAKELTNVREEVRDNPYIREALKVLKVRGYRSAIGSYWNAVVDDLRRKVMHRSLDMFNKEMNPRRTVSTYEDFQDVVTGHDLIEGAYKIGVIGWEARKLLHRARETRHVFDGHPKSSEPNLIKVLDMISDCNKYVLSQEFPPAIVDIDEYIQTLDSDEYDQNSVAVEQALVELPPIYKRELANRLYTDYADKSSSSELRANIEFCAPVLWRVLPQGDRQQIGRRFDRDIAAGNQHKISAGIDFLSKVDGLRYVSEVSRKAIFEPAIKDLEESLDEWKKEGEAVRYLMRLGTSIPEALTDRYVAALTRTFVGYKGYSVTFTRRDFYSDSAAPHIPPLFEKFGDRETEAFVRTVREDQKLKRRIDKPGQLARLRTLAEILLTREEIRQDLRDFLELLTNEERTDELFREIRAG